MEKIKVEKRRVGGKYCDLNTIYVFELIDDFIYNKITNGSYDIYYIGLVDDFIEKYSKESFDIYSSKCEDFFGSYDEHKIKQIYYLSKQGLKEYEYDSYPVLFVSELNNEKCYPTLNCKHNSQIKTINREIDKYLDNILKKNKNDRYKQLEKLIKEKGYEFTVECTQYGTHMYLINEKTNEIQEIQTKQHDENGEPCEYYAIEKAHELVKILTK